MKTCPNCRDTRVRGIINWNVRRVTDKTFICMTCGFEWTIPETPVIEMEAS